ncbi:MAG TPA: type II secretion system F family protein [Flavobacteriales bacterium]|nr:type II secretion system F family protein [Flavobacteriales bacterium]
MAIEISKYKTTAVAPSRKEGKGLSSILNKEIKLFGKRFGDKQKEKFYGEMTTLVNAGVDIRTALELLEEGHLKKEETRILKSIREDIIKGKSFLQSLADSGYFSTYEVFSIKIGEESGKIIDIVKELSVYFNKRIALKRQMTGIFTYPVFLIIVSVGILYFMLNNVVPMFADVFKKFGKELPSFTQKIMALSEWTQHYFGYIFLVVGAGTGFLYTQRRKAWFRKSWAWSVVRIPLFGKLIKKVYLARFCQSMNLLISARTPLTEALGLVEKMIDFYPLETALAEIQKDITKGMSLHQSMQKFPVFEKRLVSLIKVAEEVNELDSMFGKLSSQYNTEVEHQTAITGKLMEPILILVIGTLVGFILVAMYQPMFEMNNLME